MSEKSWKFSSPRFDREQRQFLAVALFLLLAIALAYLNAWRVPLISDDYVDLLDLSDWGFHPGKHRAFFRPVVKLYFESLTPLLGMNPAGYHWLSQLLHWLNSLLLFAFARRFLRLKNPGAGVAERDRETLLAALLAAAFALSYAHSEAVYWIAATTTLLEALFILLTLHAYSRFLEKRRLPDLAASLLLFILGLGAKEGVFLVVALVPLYVFSLQDRFRLPDRGVLLSWLGFWSIGAAYVLAVPRVVDKAMHGGAYAFRIGVSMLKNIQQFVFSSVLWTPFNDGPLFALQQRLLGGNGAGAPLLDPWLLLGLLCLAFLAFLAWRGGFPTWAAMAMLLVATLPYSLPPQHISGWKVYPYPLRVYYVVIVFYVLLLAVFFSRVRLARSRRAVAAVAGLLAVAALANGARVFQRGRDWLHEGRKYTTVQRQIAKRVGSVNTPALWIFVVDPGDNAGIFIRHSFPLYPRYKHRLRLGESKFPTWEAATRFKQNVKKKLHAGELTIFVISGPRLLVFDAGNPGPPA